MVSRLSKPFAFLLEKGEDEGNEKGSQTSIFIGIEASSGAGGGT
jgi:hypothetical protein